MRSELFWKEKTKGGYLVRAASYTWGALNSLRRRLYQYGLLPSQKAPLPLISVGNLTVGGSAKTPMAIYLAGELIRRGLNPAVLSRGYGRKRSRLYPDPVLVSLGLGPLVALDYSGDEPQLVAKLTRSMVLVSKKRSLAAAEAVKQGADCLILDDGFQHLSLKRDLDILMFQGEKPLGNGRVLPAGPLRENISAAAAADIFVVVGNGETPEVPKSIRNLSSDKPIFTAKIEAGAFSSLRGQKRLEVDFLKGKRLSAFCGLARPQLFKKTLLNLGLEPVAFRAFRDHEPYGPMERKALEDLLNFSRSEYLLTTLKDSIKLEDMKLPILALESALVPTDAPAFLKAVLEKLPPSLQKENPPEE
ncbi:MAG: tetraacyldisaccharide 4'-kinase [Deltaproteobacteria bacterium]|jgi:tetraacyldisaccharide 4'-kinase|nr:tetraacyldisaccharide 4'-kinase [Deltaproteobacteria bacterium]